MPIDSGVHSEHEIVCFDSTYRAWLSSSATNLDLLLAWYTLLLFDPEACSVLQMWPHLRVGHLMCSMLLRHQLRVHRSLIVAVVSALLDYVLMFCT